MSAPDRNRPAQRCASHPNLDRLVERTYAYVAADVDHRVRMDGAVIGAGRIDLCDTERLERAPVGERDRGVDERRLDQRMQRLAAGRAFPDRDRGSCSSSRRAPRPSCARVERPIARIDHLDLPSRRWVSDIGGLKSLAAEPDAHRSVRAVKLAIVGARHDDVLRAAARHRRRREPTDQEPRDRGVAIGEMKLG
jgi:hypothetical protein